MTSESEIVIAFVFNRSGKNKLSFSELYLSLSMDLKWFNPAQAKDFVNLSLKQKLLKKQDDFLKPVFDYQDIVIPVGFKPSKKVFDDVKEEKVVDEKDVFKMIVKRFVEKTDMNEKEVVDKIHDVEMKKKISSEVAALLVGKEHDIIFKDFFEKIEQDIFR